jgi:hypothetical protein
MQTPMAPISTLSADTHAVGHQFEHAGDAAREAGYERETYELQPKREAGKHQDRSFDLLVNGRGFQSSADQARTASGLKLSAVV